MKQETNLIPWEEFVKEKRGTPINAEPTEIACPECGKRIYKRIDVILAVHPPVDQYFCKCGWKGRA